MRLRDLVLRQGHLSERALVEALLTGERPGHLDRCDICADRADAVGRWLDDVTRGGVQATDAMFPPEVLEAQRAKILSKLEQLDEPFRVIEFPSGVRPDSLGTMTDHRVAPRWVGIAAAAGLVLGVVGGQAMARLGDGGPATTAAQPAETVAPGPPSFSLPVEELMDLDLNSMPASLDAVHEMTPELVAVARVGG